MPKRPTTYPTDAELEILALLWRKGPLTVADVQQRLQTIRPTRYTTALKLLQTMLQKELVTRDESERAHCYRAAVQKAAVQGQVLRSMVGQVFGGSRADLILHALSSAPLDPAEIAAVRKLLEAHRSG
ncbi:MAG: BlaI/MecI/CopY family transcriptional regulator [Gemmatimonadota bacterium]